jgi:GT2 family glycosyltransferase
VVFEPTETTVATVIVLAWRLTDELLDCLEGLARGTRRNPFDVIVVLNGADDSVRSAVFERVEGATVIEVPVNLGFAGGCNLAATRARGEFLVFLNDDATPEPAWLDKLITSARVHPDAGAITSRVHSPDGSLQEAGARILASAAGMPIGLGAEILPIELSEARPVDFGGAEALLVRRELFVELGGFDQAYDPAYFEDVDLCLRLRAAGWNIVYEPSAVVIHHQSLSTNEDLEWRAFAYERSQAVFSEQWGPLLSKAANSEDPPSVLLPVPLGHGLRPLNLSQQVIAATDYATRETQRVWEFSDWLRDRLRRVSATVEELQTLTEELHAFTAGQQRELTSLQTASLHALLGWRARTWLRARPRAYGIVTALFLRRNN